MLEYYNFVLDINNILLEYSNAIIRSVYEKILFGFVGIRISPY